MNLAATTKDWARVIKKNEIGIGVPASQHMIPGKLYVGHLPGHSRKAFVRKRECTSRPLSCVAGFGDIRAFELNTPHKFERRTKMPKWLRSMFGSDFDSYDDRYRRRRVIYSDSAHRGSTRQVCSACGKFRSPSWSARHPLRYGETPKSSLCRKCVGKSTSSAETPSYSRKRRRHRHCRDHHHSSHTNDRHHSCDSSKDSCYSRRRCRSDSLGYIAPRRLKKSGSGESIKIVIQNREMAPRARVRTLSSSNDAVRVVHHVAIDRPVRHRSLGSVSSDPIFSDEVVEEVLPPRRPLRRARARSRSSVHFIDELEESSHRRRPRSQSRHSSVDEIIVSRPRSSSHRRRRRVFCDGAADTPIEDTIADRDRADEKLENASICGNNIGIADSSQNPMTSGFLQSSSAVLRADEVWSLRNRTRVAFAGPGHEADSQFPSALAATSAVSVPRLPQSSIPLHVSTVPTANSAYDSERRRCRTEPLSPAYSNDEDFTTILHHRPYERVYHNGETLTPPDVSPDSRIPFATSKPFLIKAATKTADSPDHPDHLAFLLSTAQISQSTEQKGYGRKREKDHERHTNATSFVTIRHDRSPRDSEHTKANSIISSLDGGLEVDNLPQTSSRIATAEELRNGGNSFTDYYANEEDSKHQERFFPPRRRNAMHDYIFDEEDELEQRYYDESQVDYEAEGRMHMQGLGKRLAMQEEEEEEAVHQ